MNVFTQYMLFQIIDLNQRKLGLKGINNLHAKTKTSFQKFSKNI